MINCLRKLLNRYLWIYERENGDRGFVIAATEKEAIKKLMKVYPDTEERLKFTEENPSEISGWMYLYDIKGIDIKNDVYITDPG